MKLNPDFVHRNITGENFLIPVGESTLKYNGIFTMSEVGNRIWELLSQGKNTDELVPILLNEYEIDAATLVADVEEFLSSLKSAGILID